MVSDWKDCWKWFSIHAATALIGVNLAQQLLPSFQALMSPSAFGYANAALGVLVIVGRLAAQPNS